MPSAATASTVQILFMYPSPVVRHLAGGDVPTTPVWGDYADGQAIVKLEDQAGTQQRISFAVSGGALPLVRTHEDERTLTP
jgi:hypothetical protein